VRLEENESYAAGDLPLRRAPPNKEIRRPPSVDEWLSAEDIRFSR